METVKIAFRNVLRQRRRNTLNLISIVIGVAMLLIVLCVFEGWIRHTSSLVIDKITGNLEIENKEYESHSRSIPLNINIKNTEEVIGLVSTVKNVISVTPRIDFTAYLSNNVGKVYLLGRAIEPERESEVTKIRQLITQGNYLVQGSPGILVSKNTAERLQTKVGDYIFVNAINSYGNLNPMEFKIVGIFNFSYPAIDERYFFIDYQVAQDLLFTDNATSLAVKLKKGASTRRSVSEIEKVLSPNSNLVVKPWQKYATALVSEIYGDSIPMSIMILVMLVITVFSIINTMSLAVSERKKEIGTMRAIGMKSRGIFWVFLAESLIVGLIGGFIAIAISLPVNITLSHMGIRISQQSLEVMKDLPIGNEPISGYTALWHYILGLIIATSSTLIGCIMPARRAAKMKPVDALKTL